MNRCVICNGRYHPDFLPHFPGEGYCPRCEQEILECLREMEERDEEKEEDEATHPLS